VHDDDPGASTVLEAAEKCFKQFGIAKTTMGDVARTAGISRATLYRQFADRESLVLACVMRRSRMNIAPAREYIANWPDFADRVVEGICHNVQRGHRDPLVGLLVSPDELSTSNDLLIRSGASVQLTRELWEPIFREAQLLGEMRKDVDLDLLCEWIADLEIMYISQLATAEGDPLARFRTKLRAFLVPTLLPAPGPDDDH